MSYKDFLGATKRVGDTWRVLGRPQTLDLVDHNAQRPAMLPARVNMET